MAATRPCDLPMPPSLLSPRAYPAQVTAIAGCTDSRADNFNPDANAAGAAACILYGCTDSRAFNYAVEATQEDVCSHPRPLPI